MKNLNEQINRINQLFDYEVGVTITEQSGQSIVPPIAIKAISAIEGKYSYMDNGKITGAKYSGNEKLSEMSDYIKGTIGFDCWKRMDDKFKSQIYSFCFQSDSKKPFKMKFIAGLANAIDRSINRGNIVNKDINDPNVKSAIELIKKNCVDINNFYDSYLDVLNQQYRSMDYNNNYKYIWEYRPIAIDRIVGGEDIDVVLSDWGKSIGVKDSYEGYEEIITAPNLNGLRNKIKEKQNISVDTNSFVVNIKNSNYKVKYKLGDTKIKSMSLIFDDQGQLDNRLPDIIQKNPGMEILKKGKDDNIEWALVIFK